MIKKGQITHFFEETRFFTSYFQEGNSLHPIRFGGIFLQPTTWQVNRLSTCTFNHTTFLMSHVIFSNITCE